MATELEDACARAAAAAYEADMDGERSLWVKTARAHIAMDAEIRRHGARGPVLTFEDLGLLLMGNVR